MDTLEVSLVFNSKLFDMITLSFTMGASLTNTLVS